METLNYDPVTKLMWGVGLKVVSETESYRILMTLDSKSGQFNTIGIYSKNKQKVLISL